MAVEDNIVVSEIGEQWSPNTEPDRIAENVDRKIGSCTTVLASIFISCTVMGTTTGTRIDMVAQEDTVEKLIAAAVIKVISGNRDGDNTFAEIPTRNSAVFMSVHILPMVQASTRITQAITMDRTPFIHASITPLRVKILFITVIKIAAIPDTDADQIIVA